MIFYRFSFCILILDSSLIRQGELFHIHHPSLKVECIPTGILFDQNANSAISANSNSANSNSAKSIKSITFRSTKSNFRCIILEIDGRMVKELA